MQEWRPKNLTLILAREFASKLAIPMLMIDHDGSLAFFNEPAEELLGITFAEAADLSADDWETALGAQDLEGRPLTRFDLPAGVALSERRPVHTTFALTGGGRRRRVVDATAFPLLAGRSELVGAVVLFWRAQGGART
jgi:PAS domain-containing protein